MNDSQDKVKKLHHILPSRPRIIIGITTLMTLGAAIYVYLIAKPVYEAQALVQIGKVNGGTVEPPDSIREKLVFTRQLDAPYHSEKVPALTSVELVLPQKDLIVFRSSAYSREEAVKLLKTEVDSLIKRENKIVEKGRKEYRDSIKNSKIQLKNTTSAIKKLKQEISDIDQKIQKLGKDDVALLGSYFIEIRKLRNDIERNEQWVSATNYYIRHTNLKLIDTISPKLVGEINASNKPARPRKLLIIAMAFVSGILLSLLIVLFLDFIQESRKK